MDAKARPQHRDLAQRATGTDPDRAGAPVGGLDQGSGGTGLPGTSLTRLPRAAVLAAADARLPAGLLGDYLDLLASAATSGRRLSRTELGHFRQLGQAAAEAGTSLPALVDLYLSATWRAWPSLPTVRHADRAPGGTPVGTGGAERGRPAFHGGERSDSSLAAARIRSAASAVLRASDDAVAAVCEGYESARQARARAEEALRRELVDDLLTGSSEVGPLLERAAVFGLRLEAPHVVLVAAAGRRLREGGAVLRDLGLALRTTSRTSPLVAAKDGLLVCVVPQEPELTMPPGGDGASAGAGAGAGAGAVTPVLGKPGAGTPEESAAAGPVGRSGSPDRPREGRADRTDRGFTPPRLAARGRTAPEAIRAVVQRLDREPDLGWRLGVSRARSGGGGVRLGFAEARSAVDLAGRLGLDGQAVHTDDLLIYKVLLRDREPLAELIDTVLSPLRSARGGARPLLATLDAYFATGGVAAAAARRLHLSVRALTYRLERIHTLTGLDPTSPTDRFVLQTAVLGARLLDWPAASPPQRN